MTLCVQEGPVILIGYEYRLQLEAEADLFPEGAAFAGQLRSAIAAPAPHTMDLTAHLKHKLENAP